MSVQLKILLWLASHTRFVGVGARRVRSLFQAAKKKVLFDNLLFIRYVYLLVTYTSNLLNNLLFFMVHDCDI